MTNNDKICSIDISHYPSILQVYEYTGICGVKRTRGWCGSESWNVNKSLFPPHVLFTHFRLFAPAEYTATCSAGRYAIIIITTVKTFANFIPEKGLMVSNIIRFVLELRVDKYARYD